MKGFRAARMTGRLSVIAAMGTLDSLRAVRESPLAPTWAKAIEMQRLKQSACS